MIDALKSLPCVCEIDRAPTQDTVPDELMTMALEAFDQSLLTCTRYDGSQDRHQGRLIGRGSALLIIARTRYQCGMVRIGTTLLDAADPLGTYELAEQWDGDVPSFDWINRELGKAIEAK